MRAPQRRLRRAEALTLLRRRPARRAEEPDWACAVGPLVLRFPNFRWRRRAIDAHDLHHLMTGYPMTMRGEFQMAAWEQGAGRYPHWGASLFCAPLLLAGLLWSPRAMWRAYRAGRRNRSLYSALDDDPG